MDTKNGHSIGITARMTGIPAETLRVWERRYGVPRPTRSSGGQRSYDDAEIARLRLVARAIAGGRRAGDVARLSTRTLEKLETKARDEAPIDGGSAATPTPFACLDALRRDDAPALAAELRRAALLFGPLRFVADVAQPLAVRVGKMWEDGEIDVAQEHLFTSCLSTQLRVLLATLEGIGSAPVIVLATFPGELHALGLEMVAVHVAARGGAPRLLGASLPPREIAHAARAYRADAIGVSISAASARTTTERHLRELLAATTVPVWLGGAGAPVIRAADARVIDGWRELDGAIAFARNEAMRS